MSRSQEQNLVVHDHGILPETKGKHEDNKQQENKQHWDKQHENRQPNTDQPDNNEDNGPNVIVHIVKVYNNGTEVPYASTLIEKSLLEKPLTDLRKDLVDQNVMDSRLARRRFCTKGRSDVNDTIAFARYLEMIQGSKEPDAEHDADQPEKPKEQLTVYMSVLTSTTGVDLSSAPALDLSPSADKLDLKTPQYRELKGQYDAAQWAAKAGATQNVHPYEMTEEDWSFVIANNAIPCGFLISTREVDITAENAEVYGVAKTEIGKKKNIVDMERSLYPGRLPLWTTGSGAISEPFSRKAFNIKPRQPESFELFHKSGVNAPKTPMRIPRLRVTDDSFVDVRETKTEFEHTMVKSSFSEDSYEASVGGGAFGVSASASAGHSSSTSESSTDGVSKKTDKLHVIYRFPRAELLLDQDSLEPTKECIKDWENAIRDSYEKELFFQKYGRYICTRVQVGGRLIASQDVSQTDKRNSTERKNAMKWSAGVSFSSPWVQASAKTSHEKQHAKSESTDKAEMDEAINWEAQGGETLLANSPPDWCPTVSSFHNWRVMHQYNIARIEDLFPPHTRQPDSKYSVQRALRITSLNDNKYPLWMAPSIEQFSDELKQLSFAELPGDLSDVCTSIVGYYSPLVGISDEPIVPTIVGVDKDKTIRYNTPYQINMGSGYLSVLSEVFEETAFAQQFPQEDQAFGAILGVRKFHSEAKSDSSGQHATWVFLEPGSERPDPGTANDPIPVDAEIQLVYIPPDEDYAARYLQVYNRTCIINDIEPITSILDDTANLRFWTRGKDNRDEDDFTVVLQQVPDAENDYQASRAPD